MTKEIYLILMNKLLFNYKFHNTEEQPEYMDVMLSPYYLELCKEIRKQTQLEQPDFKELVKYDEKFHASYLDRFRDIIKAIPERQKYNEEDQNSFIDIITYPFDINVEVRELIKSFFN